MTVFAWVFGSYRLFAAGLRGSLLAAREWNASNVDLIKKPFPKPNPKTKYIGRCRRLVCCIDLPR